MEFFESTTFTSLVTELLEKNRIPGLSVAIVYKNDIAARGYGIANHEDNTPCTADTLFDIASCSKSLTAASVALLVDDKRYPKIQYDALMTDLLPEDFVMSEKSYTDGITVEDVLSHRTGMASHDSAHFGPNSAHPDDANSVTRNLRNLKVAAPLRSRYLYCNQMYTVATHLVEETSKLSFGEFLEERIFVPLSMKSTTLQPTSAQARGWGDRMAKGHIWETNTWCVFEPQNCPEGQGAGSVISSASDFIKWVKALLYHEDPINDRIYHGLTKMRSIVNPNARRLKAHTTPANYTAGMELYFYRGSMVIGHDGNVPGFSSRFLFMPDADFGAVVLGNSGGAAAAATAIMRALMDEVLGVPVDDRPPQTSNRRRKSGLMNDLTIRPKKQNQDYKRHQAKHQRKDQRKESHSETLLFAPNAVAQDHNLSDKQNRRKAAREENMQMQRPDEQTKLGEKSKRHETFSAPQEMPLEAYVGRYWDAGYRTMTVQIKDDQLFIDARDRSMGFTMTFEHVKDQTKHIAHLKDDIELADDPVEARFVFKGGKAVKMGLDLEPAVKELIWFMRLDDD